jgi:hypothetical protein
MPPAEQDKNNDAPQVQSVEGEGGLTVFYRGRYLYSRFAPQKMILSAVENARVSEHTLVVCFSPALCYGVEELSKKIPEHSAMVLIENDAALFDLALTRVKKQSLAHNAFVLSPEQLQSCEQIFENKQYADFFGKVLPPPGTFRRVMRIDFSAGAALYSRFYDALERSLCDAAAQFWKNRATLMHLGRLYSRNFFLNLARLPFSRPLESLCVCRPILVVASGPSTDELLALGGAAARSFFVIAADTALPALFARGIAPGLVVQVETQFAVEAAFISAGKNRFPCAADISSRNHNADYYFFSRFAPCAFLESPQKRGILPVEIPPLGSVALYALEIALKIRESGRVPVFVCGVDFSFTAGKTHCKGTPAHALHLLNANRLCPAGGVSAAFREGARAVSAQDAPKKGSGVLITDHALLGYRALFCARFLSAPNVFDAGGSGLSLNLPRVALKKLLETPSAPPPETPCRARANNTAQISAAAVEEYLRQEETALKDLRGILSGEKKLAPDAQQKQIAALLEEREYLYLHFPDGFAPSTDTQFLMRVRAEIDFFLKDMYRAKKFLRDKS